MHLDDSETEEEPDERLMPLHREHSLVHRIKDELLLEDSLSDDAKLSMITSKAKTVPGAAHIGQATISKFLQRQLTVSKAESRMPAIPVP
jgi:hypothetical protein